MRNISEPSSLPSRRQNVEHLKSRNLYIRLLPHLALLGSILVALLPCPAQTSVDLSQASLEELQNIEVYTASRHYQSASEAPSSISVITADEIQKYGYRTLADILGSVSGFFTTYDRAYSYVGVRGFLRPGDYNTRILLMIDGHRVNDNLYDQAMTGTEFLLDVDLIQRVEVVRGPSSSLYGSNAFFAVVNVITRRPADMKNLELSFDAGSFGTYLGRVTYGGHLRDLNAVVSGTFSDSAGQNLFFPEFNSRQSNGGVARNLDYDRFHDLLLTLEFRGLTLQAIDSRREKGIPTGEYGVSFNDPRTYMVDRHQYVDLSYRRKLSPQWEILTRGYYDRYGFDGYWPYPDTGLNVDYARGQRWGAEVQANTQLGSRHNLTFGGELRHNFQQDQKNYDVEVPLVYVDDRRSSWVGAGYLQDEVKIASRLTLNAGLRHDQYQRYGGNTSPRAALIYRLRPKTTLKLLFGSAFRVPNVYEAYYGTKSASLSGYKLNPNLHPESIKNYEAGWEQTLGQSFRLTTSVFRSNISDLISLQLDPNDNMNFFRNAADAHSTGAEIEAEKNFDALLTSRLSYTFARTSYDSSDQSLADSPRHLAKLNLSVPLRRDRWFGSLEAQYESARRASDGSRVGGFPILNGTFLARSLARHLNLSASLYNLLDRHYADPVSSELPESAIPQDGRSFRVKLTWSLGE